MAPENTVPAFEFACKHNADILELDVRLSRDGELMVIHDATVDRTTNGSGLVAAMTAIELGKLDAGYRFCFEGEHQCSFRGKNVSINRLTEVLTLFPDMHFNVDIKDNTGRAADELAKVLRQCDAQDKVVLASFHHRVLQYSRERFPWLKTSASKVDVRRFYWHYLRGRHASAEISTAVFQLPVKYFVLSFSSKRFIDAVHEAGIRLDFWTINNPELIAQLISNGADGIVTDRPDIASKVIRGK